VKFAVNNNSPSLVLGDRFQPGNDDKHFCQPTDVAVMNSDIYVADGSVTLCLFLLNVVGVFVVKISRRVYLARSYVLIMLCDVKCETICLLLTVQADC